MSIDVRDLQPGDRVVLNCPKALRNQKREAQFEGLFPSALEAMAAGSPFSAQLIQRHTEAFTAAAGTWARFLLQTAPAGSDVLFTTPGGDALQMPPTGGFTRQLYAAFIVEPDGALREEEGRRIFIERRVRMGHG
jgi:hypothetical protein